MSRAHDIQLCLQEALVPAGVKSLTANRQQPQICMELRFRDDMGATWAEEGIEVQGNIDILQPIFTFSGRHTTKRDTFKKAGVGGKAVVFPWLQHAWCSSIHVWTPYLQKVPVKLAAVLQHWAETSTGEGCEWAGKRQMNLESSCLMGRSLGSELMAI